MGKIVDNTLILNRIKKHFKFKNDAEFARFLDIKPNTLSNWYTRNSIDYQKIITKCEDIDANWLLTGEGDMIKKEDDKVMQVSEPGLNHRKTKDAMITTQRIPVYNLDATMGLVPLIDNNGIDERKILDYIAIPDLPACDGATYASGDSMYPLIKAGDLVAYKHINLDPSAIFFGEIYLLAVRIDDNSTYKTIKFVHKSELGPDYIKLVSQNQHHEDKDVHLKQITAIALVRASMRIHN